MSNEKQSPESKNVKSLNSSADKGNSNTTLEKQKKNSGLSESSLAPETKKSRLTKWILFILLVTGIGLLSESFYQNSVPSIQQIEMQSQSHFVSRDFHQLNKKGQIPKYFFQIRNIKWSYHDQDLKKDIPEESIPFRATASGLYNLEIDAFSSQQKTSKIAVIQMNLIDIKTGNKIWELSRNYEIENSK